MWHWVQVLRSGPLCGVSLSVWWSDAGLCPPRLCDPAGGDALPWALVPSSVKWVGQLAQCLADCFIYFVMFLFVCTGI
jgi:hypothetical protein